MKINKVLKEISGVLFLILIIQLNSYGQSEIIWSNLEKSSSSIKSTVSDGDFIFVLKVNKNGFAYSKKSDIELIKYDKEMNVISSSFSKLKHDQSKAEPHSLVSIGNKIYLFYISYGNGNKHLLSEVLDKITLEGMGNPTLLSTIKGRTFFGKGEFVVRKSKNGSYLSIIGLLNEKKSINRANVKCFSNEFQLIFEDNIAIESSPKQIELNGTILSDNGDVYVCLLKESRKKNNEFSKIILWRYNRKDKNHKYDFLESKENMYFKSASICETPKEVVLSGYYSANEYLKETVRGMFLAKLDKASNELNGFIKEPFPTDLLHHELKESIKKRNNKKDKVEEYVGLKLMEIQEWPDKGYIVVGEQWVNQSGGHYNSVYNTVTTSSSRLIKNTIISFVDYSLNIIWSVPITKGHSFNYYLKPYSYFLTLRPNSVSIFFDSNDKVKYGKGMVVVDINEDGDVFKEILFDKGDEKINFNPTHTFQLNDDSFFIYGRNMFKEKFGILSLN